MSESPSLEIAPLVNSNTPEADVDIEAINAIDSYIKAPRISTQSRNEAVIIQQELGVRALPVIRDKVQNKDADEYSYILLLSGVDAPDEDIYPIFKEIAFKPEVIEYFDRSSLGRAIRGMAATAPNLEVFTNDANSLIRKIEGGDFPNRLTIFEIQSLKDEFEERKQTAIGELLTERRESRDRYKELFPDKPLPSEVSESQRINSSSQTETVPETSLPESGKEMSSEEKEQRRKAKILKSSPAMQALFQVVRKSEVFSHIRNMLKRAPELRRKGAQEGARFRDYTAFFASLATDPQGSILLEEAIDRHVEQNSELFREKIENGENYIPMIIIGSGPISLAFAAEYQRLNPDNQPLIVEKNLRIGGNFSTAEVEAASLNSRNRPEPVDKSLNLPGKSGNLNSLGNVMLQLPDIATEQYPPLSDLGRVVRTNHIFNKVYSGLDITELKKPDGDNEIGRFLVSATDLRDGKELTILNDRIIDTSGLGREITGLDEGDTETLEILAAEIFKEEGAQVQTFQQFQNEVGKGKNAFPLKGYSEVAIVGPGDSGKVATEMLLGYGPGRGLSVPNLDFTEKVIWFGQTAEDKTRYIAKTRVRYAELGLDFPRDEEEEYYHRIYPVSERAQRLRRTEDGKIKIIFTNDEGQEETRIVDHVIIATGFESEANEILEDTSAITEPQLINDYFDEISSGERSIIQGTRINYAPGNFRESLTIDEVDGDSVEVSVRYVDGDEINGLILNKSAFSDILRASQVVSVNERKNEILRDEDGNPVARKYADEVYQLGAPADLPIGPTELQDSPALGVIPENTAALFRSVPKAVYVARELVQKDLNSGVKTDFFDITQTPVNIQETGLRKETTVETGVVTENMHHKAPYELMMQMAILDNLHSWNFPKNLKKIEMTAKLDKMGNEYGLVLTTSESQTSEEFNIAINSLTSDQTIREALLAKVKTQGSKTAILTIPLSGGKISVEDISLKGVKINEN